MSSENSFKLKYNKLLVSSIVGTMFLACLLIYTIHSIKRSKENEAALSRALFYLSQCERSFKGFLFNNNINSNLDLDEYKKELTSVRNYARLFHENMTFLEEHLNGNDHASLVLIKTNIDTLTSVFDQITNLLKERGNKREGLEGRMLKAADTLEKSTLTDKALVYALRKDEKDFLLRKNGAYLNTFDLTASKLEEQIASLSDPNEKNNLLTALKNYQNSLREIVAIEHKLGLGSTSGLVGFLTSTITNSINELEALKTSYEANGIKFLKTTLIVLIILSIGVLIATYFYMEKFMRPVLEPIQEIQSRAYRISEGDLSVRFDEFRNNSILKNLIAGLEKIVERFKSTMTQVEAISSRKILQELPLTSDKDEVGKTVNMIILQLKKIDDEEKQRAWHNEGLALFANLLRIYVNDADELYDNFLRQLVKYIDANQGGLFIVEEEDEEDDNSSYMLMKACYAYDRKKFINKRINPGEGLAGVCWQEGETVYMTDIPEDYMHITSGVGGASPSSVVIVPVKFNDKIFGVIELASFSVIPNHQIKFIEAIAESFGSTVHNMKTGAKTRALLEQSQIMTEELRAQEEEMRQNMEELQATQEEMERNVHSLKNMTQELEIRERIFGLTTILSESDLYGTITDINTKFTEVSGYSKEELIGKPHNILRDPDMPKELFKLFWNTIKAGKIFKGIIKNRGKGGKVYWVSATIVPIKDEDGKIVRYVGARYHIEDEEFALHMYNKQAVALGLPQLKNAL